MDMAIIKLQLVNYCEVVNGGLFEIGHSFIRDMDECDLWLGLNSPYCSF